MIKIQRYENRGYSAAPLPKSEGKYVLYTDHLAENKLKDELIESVRELITAYPEEYENSNLEKALAKLDRGEST